MSVAVVVAVGLLTAFGLGMTAAFLAFDAAGYRPLRRAVGRGDIDPRPGPVVRPFTMNQLGTNPDIEYRYLPYAIPPGHVGVLHGALANEAEYFSVVVYDSWLQSVLPEHSSGPTLLTERELGPDAQGRFVAVLARDDRGWPNFLDIGAVPDGVLFERHIGAAPEPLSTLEVVAEAEAAAYIDGLRRPG